MGSEMLHPDGRCTCGGDWTCAWCRKRCIHCGEIKPCSVHCRHCGSELPAHDPLCCEVGNELTKLRAENARLREALEDVVNNTWRDGFEAADAAIDRARDALKGAK